MRAKMNKESDDYIRALSTYERVLMWVIDRANEGEGVQLYAMSTTLDREFAAQSVDSETGEVLRIDHPYEGFDIIFSREGTGLKTKYSGLKIARNPSPISSDEQEMDEWLAFVKDYPLSDALKFYEYEKIQKAFGGQTSRKNDDEEERPTRKGLEEAPAKRHTSLDDDEIPQTRKKVQTYGEEDVAPRGSKRGTLDNDEEARPTPASKDRRFQESRTEFRKRIDEVAVAADEDEAEEEEVTDLRKKIRKGLQAIED
jgi:hypothetical protein